MARIAMLPFVIAIAAAQTFTLEHESGNKVTLPRPANGRIPLWLMFDSPKPEETPPKAHLSAPTLVAVSGTAAPVDSVSTLLGTGRCEQLPADRSLDLDFKNGVAEFCLFVNPIAAGTYSGDLLITAAGMKPARKQFDITQPPPAALTATSMAVGQPGPIELMLPCCSFAPGRAAMAVTLQEKTGKAAVEGLVARMDVVKSPSAYDPSKVNAKWNGKDSALFVSDPSRIIPAGEQARVDLTLNGLEPGEYNLVFRFSGVNALADDAQKLTAVIHVRPHWLLPALLILIATMVSFFSNKVVAAKRRRFGLMEKIGGLRPAWLGAFAETQPVVWVRAMLSQAETLSSRYWLTSPDTIEGRVNAVGNVLKILDEARRLRQRLLDALDPLVFRRVIQSLERLVGEVGAGALDDQSVGKFETQMTAFEGWLAKERYSSTLWGEIQPGMLRLQAAIAANQAEAPAVPAFAVACGALNTALTTQPTTAAATDAAYRNFMTLTILWNCRHDKDTLAACGNAGGDLPKLFDLVDRRDWQDLKAAALAIQLPANDDTGGLQAFDPLQFSITAGGAAVERSYLFHRNITCAWRFRLTPKRRFLRRTPDPVTLNPRTLGPSVMQYFPVDGDVEVSAVLSFQGESHPVPLSEKFPIRPSREFGVLKGFERAELLSYLIAAAMAIASGLSIYYVNAAGWGSFKDILTLFIWGAGVDQGKNLIQSAASPAK